MNKLDAALKRYYRSIRHCLPSSRKLKAKILNEIESNVISYLQKNPNADFATIEAHFGAPEQIACAYVDDLDTSELLRKLQIRKRIIIISISAISAVLILWLGVVGWAAIREYDHSKGNFTDVGIVETTP